MSNLTIYVYIYMAIGMIWGFYAGIKQWEVYPDSSCLKGLFVGLINYAFWPICINILAIRCLLEIIAESKEGAMDNKGLVFGELVIALGIVCLIVFVGGMGG